MKQRIKRMIVIFALLLGIRSLTPVFAQEFRQYKQPVEQILQQKEFLILQYEIEGDTVKIELNKLILDDIRKDIGLLDRIRLASYFKDYEKEDEWIEKQKEEEFNKLRERKKEVDELEWKFYVENNKKGLSKEQERLIASKRNELKKDEKKSSNSYWEAYNKNNKILYERIYNLLALKLLKIAKLHNNKSLILLIDWCSKYSEERLHTLKSFSESILRNLR